MWDIYDTLIAGIPEDLVAEQLICGNTYTVVTNRLGAGMSSIIGGETRLPLSSGNLLGKPLKQVAELVKSWNFPEASLGQAAINSYYNNPVVARQNGIEFSDAAFIEDRLNDPFITSQNEVRSKKVAVVGHFPYLETLFEPVCDLSIIEWEPEEQGDYPLSACEYILPDCDYVFLTCRSVLDKSFPRLLRLSQAAKRAVMVGPATTLAPHLLAAGIGDLSGFVIKDPEKALRVAAGAESGSIYGCGQKVSLKTNNKY